MMSNKIEKSGSSFQLVVNLHHNASSADPLTPDGAVNFYSLTLRSPESKQKKNDKRRIHFAVNSIVLDMDSVCMERLYGDSNTISIVFNKNLRGCNIFDKLSPIIRHGAYELNAGQVDAFMGYFYRICSEALSNYRYRKDLLSDLLSLLNHHILKELVLPSFYLSRAN